MSDLPPHKRRIRKSADATYAAALGRKALPKLREALYHPNEEVRQAAAWALGEIGDTFVLPDLLAALGDPDWLVRRNVIAALVKLGDAAAVPRLLPVLSDPDPRLRSEAAAALGAFGAELAVSPLITLLSDEEECKLQKFEALRVCDVAAAALEKIGTPAALTAAAEWRSGQAQAAAPSAE